MARGLAIDPKIEATKLLKNAAYGAHIVERRWPNVDGGDYRPVEVRSTWLHAIMLLRLTSKMSHDRLA